MLIKQFFPKTPNWIIFRKFASTDIPTNFYTILGISDKSTSLEIRQAYLGLAKKHHPDCPSGNAEKFKQVNEAYRILSDKSLRSLYDSGNFYQKGPKTNEKDNSQNYQEMHEEWLRQKEKKSQKSQNWENTYYNGKSIAQIFKEEKERQRKYQQLLRGNTKVEKNTWMKDGFAFIYTYTILGLIFYTVYQIWNKWRQRKIIKENLHSIKMWKLEKEIERLKQYDEIKQSESKNSD